MRGDSLAATVGDRRLGRGHYLQNLNKRNRLWRDFMGCGIDLMICHGIGRRAFRTQRVISGGKGAVIGNKSCDQKEISNSVADVSQFRNGFSKPCGDW
ncbi:hypothetical protein CEXT_384831 [Caerostris extrusa]|uniref:Uncharacterized protein n=1 Tax=Caerostris extrusa TaxID=172846 RepID=A0AAV4QRL5_CAEEX|nr:hypothetical protein CEXT_384831 [Caerostris extrusa]